LRDTESVPLAPGDDPVDADGIPASVRASFDREVAPHVPDAWIDTTRRDPKDGRVGLVGYEINFNRYVYRYTPPRPLEEIEADIRTIEADILRLLGDVAGGLHRRRFRTAELPAGEGISGRGWNERCRYGPSGVDRARGPARRGRGGRARARTR